MPKRQYHRSRQTQNSIDERVAKLLARQTPLEYMLAVMHDETAPQERRDRMAMAAAAFCHSRRTIEYVGKKETRARDSKTAGIGTPWGKLLQTPETIIAAVEHRTA
jgi:hypothetical protein